MSSSSSAQLKRLKPAYECVVNNFLFVLAVPLAVAAIVSAARVGPEELLAKLQVLRPVHVFLAAFVPAAAAILYLMMRPRAVYLVDYACFRTKPNYLVRARGGDLPAARAPLHPAVPFGTFLVGFMTRAAAGAVRAA